ncbi:MAG: galactokinase [Luminiphilus sp.]|nr:galactokinase [Luminiphilus sp.]
MTNLGVSLSPLVDEARNALEAWSGRQAAWFAAAPGRVNVIGEHTDYNAGWVLPVAIDRFTLMAAAAGTQPGRLRVLSLALNEQGEILLGEISTPHPSLWVRYVQGVVAHYEKRGIHCPALDIVVASNLPAGGGLSSSAALELATAHLIEAATGRALSERGRIDACVAAEREYAGVPCGEMDQTIVEMAQADHALLLDCRERSVSHVPFALESVALVALHSGISHELADGAYAQRREECQHAASVLAVDTLRDVTIDRLARLESEPLLHRRARHIVSENARVHGAVAAMARYDWKMLGNLMVESHRSLQQDYCVSCRELDLLVDMALSEPGVFGARMTGGGFGGCIIVLIDKFRTESVVESMCRRYAELMGREPPCYRIQSAWGANEICAAL